jgi:hypothetical protein
VTTDGGWEFRSIPIDFDVFKALTASLETPVDSYNDVLRRLLKLGAKSPAPSPSPTSGRAWFIDGVTFPEGTEFRAKYKGQFHSARVENGALTLRGKRFDSPSPAAMTITGGNVNGWKFWECRFPGESAWKTIDGLRRK